MKRNQATKPLDADGPCACSLSPRFPPEKDAAHDDAGLNWRMFQGGMSVLVGWT